MSARSARYGTPEAREALMPNDGHRAWMAAAIHDRGVDGAAMLVWTSIVRLARDTGGSAFLIPAELVAPVESIALAATRAVPGAKPEVRFEPAPDCGGWVVLSLSLDGRHFREDGA